MLAVSQACRFWIDLFSTKARTFLFTANKNFCCIVDPKRKRKEPRGTCNETRLFLTAKRHKKAQKRHCLKTHKVETEITWS